MVIQILVSEGFLQQHDEKYKDKMETASMRRKLKFYQANMEVKTTGRIFLKIQQEKLFYK